MDQVCIMDEANDSKLFVDMDDGDKWKIVNIAFLMLEFGEPTKLYLKRLLDYNQLLVKYDYLKNGKWDMNRAFSLILNTAGRIQTNLIVHDSYDIVKAQEFMKNKEFLTKIEECCIKAKGDMDEFKRLKSIVLN